MSASDSGISPQNLMEQVGQSLVQNDIMLARIKGGIEAVPLHDKRYPQEQAGFVTENLTDTLSAQNYDITFRPKAPPEIDPVPTVTSTMKPL